MSAVFEAVSDAFGDVVEFIGDVAEDVVDIAEQVVDTVAENPLLIVAAIAAPYALATFAAEAAVVTALEVAATADAIATGVAVLEATEVGLAVASAETFAATTVLEAGATIAEAASAVTAVSEGVTIAEAVATATGGAVEAGAIAEVASANAANAGFWETLSQAAQGVTQTIGETLLPGLDPALQKVAGQLAINTATNGGDFGQAVESTFLSMGFGQLGGAVAGATGSDIAGRLAANAAQQQVTTGDVNLTSLAGGELGSFVGSKVAGATGSDLLGKAASNVTNSVVQDRDPLTGLVNLGINEGVNAAFDYGSGLLGGAPKAETSDDIIGAIPKDAIVAPPVVENVGGLNAVQQAEQTPMTGAETSDDIIGAIPKDAIVAPPVVENIGGLNAVQQAGQTKYVQPYAQTTQPGNISLAGVAEGVIKNNIIKSLKKSVAPPRPSSGFVTQNRRPPRMDVSKLMPIAKARVKPVAPVGKLTPTSRISGLTSLLKQAG